MRETQQERPAVTKACVKEVIMTREDVLKLFPDATDEQITNLLNQNNTEVAREKTKANQYKEKAGKVDELQTQLDEINSKGMTENEKLTKALDTANKTIADLQKGNAIRDLREKAMSDFKITSEQAKTVVKDDGSFDTAVLGQIIAEKETASATAKEQELANKAGNPGGGNGSGGDDTKTTAEKLVEKHLGGQKQNNDILSHYVGGN